MDLRVIKTEKIITESFMELRKKMPLEKIKVKDICELALINKSTFYKHYSDVFDLSDKLENEFVSSLIESQDWVQLFSDPESFLNSLKNHFDNQNVGKVGPGILFRDRIPVFWQKFSKGIIHHYRNNGGENYATAMLFIMGGLSFTRFFSVPADAELQDELLNTFVSYIQAIGETLK